MQNSRDMRKLYLILVILALVLDGSGQNSQFELFYTAINNADYVQLDSIKVMNRTQGGDTVLYWPDTVLILEYSFGFGLPEPNNDAASFEVFQNYPNPMTDHTTISLFVPEKDRVSMMVTDGLGRIMLKAERVLDQGTHSFRLVPWGGNLYFFTAQWRSKISSIKILRATNNAYSECSLEYIGSETSPPQLKASEDIQNFNYNLGDELLYIGYAGSTQSGILDTPETNRNYTFEFATNIPCPGTPTVEYNGQVYNTIQIFSQCWLKENLNLGTMIQGTDNMTMNGIIEKYCYNDEPDSCDKYGGLYQWNETMQYTTQEGIKGICPYGWHLPTDEEWKVLAGAVDSQFGIGDSVWDLSQVGYDAGKNLKSTYGWHSGSNGADLFGFTGLAGGGRRYDAGFYSMGQFGTWWTSNEVNDISARLYLFSMYGDRIDRFGYKKSYGLSVRCVKDPGYVTILNFTANDHPVHIKLDSIRLINRTQGGEKILYYPDTIIALEYELPLYVSGDELLCIGYVNGIQSGILDAPETNKNYIFQFATNIPCPGTPTITYQGQVYNTIQIFNQCWLKENLNVGTEIQVNQDQSNNGIIEKYCYSFHDNYCNSYGGLYQWNEMMQYTTQQGSQGICPPGWHLPADDEWKLLEGAVDSKYGIGDPEWDIIASSFRGFDAGKNLKTTTGWSDSGNGTDLFGFSGLPGGARISGSSFSFLYYVGFWWSSTVSYNESAWCRFLLNSCPGSFRARYGKQDGHSVRCIRD